METTSELMLWNPFATASGEISGVRPVERPSGANPLTHVGPYRLLALLGKGGMGVVYLAERTDGERVALKCIAGWARGGEHLARRFDSEAYVHRSMRHPNIVRVLDYGVDPERYLAMEHVDGVSVHTLSSWLDALPVAACIYLAERTAAALAYAHSLRDGRGRPLGIVHRDVSPSNLLVSTRGTVKLTDFGLARHEERTWQTTTGMPLGKMGYMPPELVLGERAGTPADVYSLGVVLWECLTGRYLVPRRNLLEAAERIVEGGHPVPSSLRRDIPPALDRIVARMLRAHPADRPSARAVARELATLGDSALGRAELARAVRLTRRATLGGAPC